MKDVILTFDYELFFGENSGTLYRSVLYPTSMILEALKTVNGKAVFFVDYLMLKRLLNENRDTKLQAEIVIDQLMKIVRQGSLIELHLHPHWLDAIYKGNGFWDFSDFSHYSLSSLPEDTVTELFDEGTEFLTNIAKAVSYNYRVKAFRAGGWSIEPFSHLRKGLVKSGVYIDSSVIPGMIIRKDYYEVDFSKAPDLDYYFFSDCINDSSPNGEFCEVPITTYRLSKVRSIETRVDKCIHQSRYRRLTDGTHYVREKNNANSRRIHDIFGPRVCTLNGMSKRTIKTVLQTSYHSLLVFSSHPKDYTSVVPGNISTVSECANLVTYDDLPI